MDLEGFDAVEEIIVGVQAILAGRDLETITVAMSALLSEIVYQYKKTPKEIRAMYRMWGDAAVLMAQLEDEFTSNPELQAAKDAAQKERTETAGQKTGNVPGTSCLN